MTLAYYSLLLGAVVTVPSGFNVAKTILVSLSLVPKGIDGTWLGVTKMPQCMPDEYKDKCSVQAYWNYYIGEKHIVANLKTEKLYDRRPKETY